MKLLLESIGFALFLFIVALAAHLFAS